MLYLLHNALFFVMTPREFFSRRKSKRFWLIKVINIYLGKKTVSETFSPEFVASLKNIYRFSFSAMIGNHQKKCTKDSQAVRFLLEEGLKKTPKPCHFILHYWLAMEKWEYGSLSEAQAHLAEINAILATWPGRRALWTHAVLGRFVVLLGLFLRPLYRKKKFSFRRRMRYFSERLSLLETELAYAEQDIVLSKAAPSDPSASSKAALDKNGFEHLCLEAKQGNASAQYDLAYRYESGLGVHRSYKLALSWYQKAAAQNHPDAEYAIGEFYKAGLALPESSEEAKKHYTQAAALGCIEAYTALGDLYFYGLLPSESPESAIAYYQEGANRNDPKALYRLGLVYGQSDSLVYSLERAMEYHQQASALGYTAAMVQEGVIYENQEVAQPSYAKAFKCYRHAAALGNEEAQCYLAHMYYQGNGCLKSYIKAHEWYRQAAKENQPSALYMLARLYAEGNGVKQSNKKALLWCRKAVSAGSSEAKDLLQDLQHN